MITGARFEKSPRARRNWSHPIYQPVSAISAKGSEPKQVMRAELITLDRTLMSTASLPLHTIVVEATTHALRSNCRKKAAKVSNRQRCNGGIHDRQLSTSQAWEKVWLCTALHCGPGGGCVQTKGSIASTPCLSREAPSVIPVAHAAVRCMLDAPTFTECHRDDCLVSLITEVHSSSNKGRILGLITYQRVVPTTAVPRAWVVDPLIFGCFSHSHSLSHPAVIYLRRSNVGNHHGLMMQMLGSAMLTLTVARA